MTDEIKVVTDEAIQRGLEHADTEWKDMALRCLKAVCLEKERFTMNDVRWLIDASLIKTHDKRAIGGVMRKAKTMGWINSTGEFIRSKIGHGIPMTVWRSLLYKPKDKLF